MPPTGEAAALVVGEAQASQSLRRPQEPILLEHEVDHRLLLAIDPPGDHQEKNASGGGNGAMSEACPRRCAASSTMSITPNFRRHTPSSGCVDTQIIG
jgi:hypothetical protein